MQKQVCENICKKTVKTHTKRIWKFCKHAFRSTGSRASNTVNNGTKPMFCVGTIMQEVVKFRRGTQSRKHAKNTPKSLKNRIRKLTFFKILANGPSDTTFSLLGRAWGLSFGGIWRPQVPQGRQNVPQGRPPDLQNESKNR